MSSGADAFWPAMAELIEAAYTDGAISRGRSEDTDAAEDALYAAHAAAVAEAEARGRAVALREVDEACTAIDLSAPARGVSLVFPPSGPRAGQWVCWGQPGDKASDATPTAAILRLAAALRAEAQP